MSDHTPVHTTVAADRLGQRHHKPLVVEDGLHSHQRDLTSFSLNCTASVKAVDILTAMAVPVELSDHESLVKSASTSLNSKVVNTLRFSLRSTASVTCSPSFTYP
ncbi:unnamed protein product [Vicia faba]|uniref:Uncharacterized protein n=1 Tax=Vicia faba TaxID=3906 RepID=A0AAV0ZC20_VICFA|nr:unnamed protein product [Vicia faba]